MKTIILSLVSILTLSACSNGSREVNADGVTHEEHNKIVAINNELKNEILTRVETLEAILPTPGPQGPIGPQGGQGDKGETGVVSVSDLNSLLTYNPALQALNFNSDALLIKSQLPSCGAGEKWNYNSGTNTFSCTLVVVNKTAVNGLQAELDLKANVGELTTLLSSLKAVATSGDYADLANKPIIPTTVSQLTNDSGYLTSISNLDSSKLVGAIATSSSGSSTVDFSAANTITVSSATGSTLSVNGLKKGGSYTVIIEDTTTRTYSISAPFCTSIKYISTVYTSSGVSIFSILVSETSACYVSFRTGL